MTEFSGEIISLDRAETLNEPRIATGIGEFDRVLGGGLTKGQTILLAGPPGVGKSTLMLLVANSFSSLSSLKVLYISGEESPQQIAGRAERLLAKSGRIYLLSETNMEKILKSIKKAKPALIILDSIQTVYHPEIPSSSGSLVQIRECAGEIIRMAKKENISLFMLGHVTKDGMLAGPKMLEHMVDTVFYLDMERNNFYRILRSFKNRFGPTDEIGIFEMKERGLFPAGDFSLPRSEQKSEAGKALSMALEGSRCMPVEIQALVSRTYYPYPRRTVAGMDLTRAQVLVAAIEKKLNIPFDARDIFISLQGGIKIRDTAVDLALCAAIISSAKNIYLPSSWIFFGEVGILAQISSVPFVDKRLMEAERLGFDKIFMPKSAGSVKSGKTVEIENLVELMEYMRKQQRI